MCVGCVNNQILLCVSCCCVFEEKTLAYYIEIPMLNGYFFSSFAYSFPSYRCDIWIIFIQFNLIRENQLWLVIIQVRFCVFQQDFKLVISNWGRFPRRKNIVDIHERASTKLKHSSILFYLCICMIDIFGIITHKPKPRLASLSTLRHVSLSSRT